MSNDSFEAGEIPDGLVIEEKKKGAVKMLLVLSGIAVVMIGLSLLLALFAPDSTLVQFIAPILFWGGSIVAIVSFIAIVMKSVKNSDPVILFNSATSTLTLRGRDIPFNAISNVTHQTQNMMGQTANFIFLTVNGKRTTLFSLSVISKDVDGIIALKDRIKEIVGC